ncbi:MAG TPA: T9SS type A sorting domain-containing protein, partial [Bacteroidia bacterium]|nr:T9SS type A sorting domain-containing protein [Bacteroidia bacterium]
TATLTAVSGNDNFACATPLTLNNGGSCLLPTTVAGTCNGSTLETNEDVDCQAYGHLPAAVAGTVWYSFTVTGATGSGPFFVNLAEVTDKQNGGVNEYFHGMEVWYTTQLPSTTCSACACQPLQCMDNEDIGYESYHFNGCGTTENNVLQQAFTKYSVALNNLPNGTYYIQVGYSTNSFADAFAISVTSCLPTGYTLTNPLSLTGSGQVSAGGTCYTTAGYPNCPDNECPLITKYIHMTGNNCSSNGNITVCTTCPSGTVASNSCAYPCFNAIVSNGSGLNVSSSSATYPAGYYPDASSLVPNTAITWSSLTAGMSGAVVPPGYAVSFCYDFSTTGTDIQSTGGIENDFDAVGINYGGGCTATAGNTVYWSDWSLYNSTMSSLLACGNISSFTLSGLGCNATYVLCMSSQTAYGYVINSFGGSYTFYPYASQGECNPTTGLCTLPLPISLASFQVEYQQSSNQVVIYWSTASEKNNKFFTVEKTIDGINWETVTTVPGAGNSDQMLYYNAVDENPWAGISYYRLKQTDYDGSFAYSQDVMVNIPTDYSVHIFPNPTSGNMTLRYGTKSPDPISVRITDISGNLIASYNINEIVNGVNDYTVYTANLGAGMYIMQVSNAQKTFYLKFVKQ